MQSSALTIDPPKAHLIFAPRPRSSRHFAAFFSAALGLGCSPAREQAPAARTPPREGATARDGPSDASPSAFDIVELPSVPVRLRLPSPARWHATREGSFTVLARRESNERLTLRVWRAARLVRPEECETEARRLRSTLPVADPSTVVDSRRIDAPAGYDVRLVVGVEPSAEGVHGYAVAVGAAVSRCYAGVYEIWAGGPGAVERVAEQLAVMVPAVIETLVVPKADEPGQTRPTRN